MTTQSTPRVTQAPTERVQPVPDGEGTGQDGNIPGRKRIREVPEPPPSAGGFNPYFDLPPA